MFISLDKPEVVLLIIQAANSEQPVTLLVDTLPKIYFVAADLSEPRKTEILTAIKIHGIKVLAQHEIVHEHKTQILRKKTGHFEYTELSFDLHKANARCTLHLNNGKKYPIHFRFLNDAHKHLQTAKDLTAEELKRDAQSYTRDDLLIFSSFKASSATLHDASRTLPND